MKQVALNRVPHETQAEEEENKNIGIRILTLLRQRILNWSYPPGHHLGEICLCNEFDSSRIPVREALRALTEQGLVDKIPNQGCFVKQPDVEELTQTYDMRMALELFVIHILATQPLLKADWITSQRNYWEPLLNVKADETVDADKLVDADTLFHFGLAEAARNRPICMALKEINARLRFVRLAAITNPHRIQATAGEHLAIIDAIEKQDPDDARRSLRQNINHSRNQVEIAIGRALMNAHQGMRKR
jgi:DNA-binding GntR family transcriptional regulator